MNDDNVRSLINEELEKILFKPEDINIDFDELSKYMEDNE